MEEETPEEPSSHAPALEAWWFGRSAWRLILVWGSPSKAPAPSSQGRPGAFCAGGLGGKEHRLATGGAAGRQRPETAAALYAYCPSSPEDGVPGSQLWVRQMEQLRPLLPPTQGMSDTESHHTDFVTVPMGRAGLRTLLWEVGLCLRRCLGAGACV